MEEVKIGSLMLEKVNLKKQDHVEFIKYLASDQEILKNLGSLLYVLSKMQKRQNDPNIFDTCFIVKDKEEKIGYLETTELASDGFVGLYYAVCEKHRENQDNKRYGTIMLKEASNYLLNNYIEEINGLYLIISHSNIKSIKTALRSGFERSTRNTYYKTK